MQAFINKNYKEFLLIAGVFLSLFLIGFMEYGYSFYLRNKVSRAAPLQWKEYPLNGPCTPLVPWWCDVYKYIGRVNQVRIYGVPRDPFIKENSSPSSWILDSALFYVISTLTYPFKSLDTGWAFASSITLSFWFLLLYVFLRKIFWKSELEWKYHLPYVLLALLPVCFGRAFETILIDCVTFKFNLGRDLSHLIGFGLFPRELLSPFPTPLLTSLFLFGWLAILICYLGESSFHWVWDILLGFLCGLLILIHIPEWLFGIGTLSILWILSILAYKREPKILRPLTRICLASFFVSLLIVGFKILESAPEDFFKRVVDHPAYHFSYNFYLIFGLWSIYYSFKGKHESRLKAFWYICGCALMAGFLWIAFKYLFAISANTPAIMTRILYPLTSIMFCVFLMENFGQKLWFKRLASYLVPVALVTAFFNVKSVAEKNFMFFGFPQSWEDSIGWLNRHANKEDKLLVLSPLLHRTLAGKTHLKFHVAEGHPTLSSTPRDENLKKMAVLLTTLGIDADLFANEYYRVPDHNIGFIYSRFSTGDFSVLDYYHKGWDFFLTNSVDKDGVILRHILSLLKSAEPLKESYYVWLNRSDFKNIKIQPGWNMVYQNTEVTIYQN